MPRIPTPRRFETEDFEFQTSLGYIENLSVK
jgi:hypothetical protein